MKLKGIAAKEEEEEKGEREDERESEMESLVYTHQPSCIYFNISIHSCQHTLAFTHSLSQTHKHTEKTKAGFKQLEWDSYTFYTHIHTTYYA